MLKRYKKKIKKKEIKIDFPKARFNIIKILKNYIV